MEHLYGVDIQSLVSAAGYIGLFAIVFAESGVFIGAFLPGDSLLFTAGLFAAQGYFSVPLLIAVFTIAAILGDSFGYWFGKRMGEPMRTWKDTWYFKKEYLKKTEEFYKKHGKKTLVIARFTPVVRTFAPILAGAGQMHYGTFLTYNVVGALLWATSMTLGGFAFGNLIPDPDKYLLPVIAIIVLVSLSPALYAFIQSYRRER
jgi:membrane-associated protein